MNAKVYLIGAGPGDPELLTVKALRILEEADVVLHDDLVAPKIVQLARPGAHVENVGKRCGQAHIAQSEIHMRMVDFARQGLRVVRLKGGDPLLFGRLSEEIEALREAGVEFEIVPGVTAAFGAAAAAGIPLTDRRFASKVVLLTNHRCTGIGGSRDMWTGSENETAIVYMPGTNYGELCQRLIESWFAVHTPCLVVSRATSENQHIFSGTLASLANAENLPAPAIVIVGAVAGGYAGNASQRAHMVADVSGAMNALGEAVDLLR